MRLLKPRNRVLDSVDALQCLLRYLLFNLSRLVNSDAQSNIKKLTRYFCLFYKSPDDKGRTLLAQFCCFG